MTLRLAPTAVLARPPIGACYWYALALAEEMRTTRRGEYFFELGARRAREAAVESRVAAGAFPRRDYPRDSYVFPDPWKIPVEGVGLVQLDGLPTMPRDRLAAYWPEGSTREHLLAADEPSTIPMRSIPAGPTPWWRRLFRRLFRR